MIFVHGDDSPEFCCQQPCSNVGLMKSCRVSFWFCPDSLGVILSCISLQCVD